MKPLKVSGQARPLVERLQIDGLELDRRLEADAAAGGVVVGVVPQPELLRQAVVVVLLVEHGRQREHAGHVEGELRADDEVGLLRREGGVLRLEIAAVFEREILDEAVAEHVRMRHRVAAEGGAIGGEHLRRAFAGVRGQGRRRRIRTGRLQHVDADEVGAVLVGIDMRDVGDLLRKEVRKADVRALRLETIFEHGAGEQEERRRGRRQRSRRSRHVGSITAECIAANPTDQSGRAGRQYSSHRNPRFETPHEPLGNGVANS